MNISAMQNEWENCKETQQLKNKAAYGRSRDHINKEEALEMLRQGATNVEVHEKTGINKSSISVYKSQLKLS